MGAPRFAPPMDPAGRLRTQAQDEYVVQLAHGERIEHLRFGAVSMGNPHAVIEVADVDAAAVDAHRSGAAARTRHSRNP